MRFISSETESSTLYKLLSGTVIPRPIGWISSINEDGLANLAPFSFFNAVGEDPPHIMFSTVRTGDKNKDTLNNVLNNKEFVVNLVTEHLVEAMNTTSAPIPPNESEFDLAGLDKIPSDFVKPPRVKDAMVHFECKMVHHYFLEDHKNGGACIVVGRILCMHVNDDIVNERFHIDMEKYRPVARLAGSNYTKLGEIFSIKRKLS